MSFIKQKELENKRFGVEFENAKKSFAIWDKENKARLVAGDEIVRANGSRETISENIELTKEDLEKYNYMISYIRKINVEGNSQEDLYCGFSYGVEKQIGKIIKDMKSVAQISFEQILFILKKKQNSNGYEVSATKKGEKEIVIPNVENDSGLNEKEKKIVETYNEVIKKHSYDTSSEEVKATYISGMVDNGITRKRAEELYDNFIAKK